MMTKLSMSCSCNTSTTLSLIPNIPPPALPPISPHQIAPILLKTSIQHRPRAVAVFAAKSGGFPLNSFLKKCESCGGKGAIECQGCKGTGRNKKNGNIFERWKCFDCQGFGMKGCPSCGQGGLTPEQRGER
ncbi:uncharacterized protein LOC103962343 isoform X1 [Pyrus x bretschneideri]|uniref:uncharacterized protein LOC103962343 isoform X1 n=1 Tax=Pyrus x bretschneideri TaxID=225117 RepID=UPI00202E7EE5|nr:uncharacterized protein LOC103962343 isoform X1 [Pyrus x bretschneideri]